MSIRLKRDELLQIRLTSRERAATEALALSESATLSEVVRQLIREAAQAKGVWPTSQVLHQASSPQTTASPDTRVPAGT